MQTTLSVGEVARRSGVAVSALHFYESKGLVRSFRTEGNQRRYDRDVLRRVAIIRAGQELGISLAELSSAMASLPAERAPSGSDWQAMASNWADALDTRIARLQKLRAGLTSCIGCGCLSTEICPLRNPGDRAAALGPGAHYLSGSKDWAPPSDGTSGQMP